MNINIEGIYTALSTKFTYNHDLDIPTYLLNIKLLLFGFKNHLPIIINIAEEFTYGVVKAGNDMKNTAQMV